MLVPRSEVNVEDKIRDVLSKFINQKFNGITIRDVIRQYGIEGRKADIVVLKDDGKPILIIETKKKYERRGYRSETRFIPTSEHVVGQAVAYAALLKKYKGVHVPFIATANDAQLVLFTVPEDVENIVNWNAIEEREYGKVVKDFYKFRRHNILFCKSHRFSEEFFGELLETITGIYVRKYGVEEKRQELHWTLIEDFRSFIDYITPFIQEAIAPNGRFKEDLAKRLEKYKAETGYEPTPEGLAREMAYVLLNKIVFYKVLERYYSLPKLEPLYEKGVVETCSMYLSRLREFFDEAVKVSGDFEAIFKTGIYDDIDLVESQGVLEGLDWLIRLIDRYEVERLGDIVGFIYEELIPGEERHVLGQFYTPRPIAELIVKWCVRSPDDKILDPGCGSGTFLVEAYRRLAELKLKKPFPQIKHVPGDVHRQILRQLYGVDINEFPAHLTAINIAMKNVREPSTEMHIFIKDYFTIAPGQHILTPFKVKTPRGEEQAEAVFKDFDAIIGNPPYTRWTEIPESTKKLIKERLAELMSRYNLIPQVPRVEPGMHIYWIMHSTKLLKEGGRLGMIISDSWLQTAYGVSFFKFLLDNYKIHAIIDISARVFPIPLIGTCIVLLEKSSDKEERRNNKVALAYLDLSQGDVNVEDVLRIIDEAKREEKRILARELPSGAQIIVKVYKQGELEEYKGKVVNFIFGAEETLEQLRRNPLIRRLSELFEPSYGNILYLYLTSLGRIRGVRNVGGEKFFYLTEERARDLGISNEYLYPLIPSPRYLKFFTFDKRDWEEIKREGSEGYLFLCHKPRSILPESIRRYIQLGEGPNAQIRLRRKPGEAEGKPVSESQASQVRREHRNIFFDWYDLGGVIETSVYVARGTQYWIRFILAKFQCALDDRVLALIPRQNVEFSEIELKALLAYLNSSFGQLQAEVMGRSTGGGMLELDVKPLSDFLMLDVKRLSREDVEKLAKLFDKLEFEARKLGGADTVENVYGSELAKELTGRSDVRANVAGLYNTVIKEIDYEVARILGFEHLVETIRSLVLELARRRLSRAGEAEREAIRGVKEPLEVERPKRRVKRVRVEGATSRLTEFFKES